ncbi:MAG TPA: hypothetical protein VNO19_13340 [Gemmatimonadales bacterium]|nr:hypothetical protein [Gemmatimonadales bacterium]
MRWMVYALLAVAAGSAAACERPEMRAEGAPVRVVDSILTRDEALRRFRAGLAPVTALEGGRESRDTLVVRFLRALKVQDTLALASMAVTRPEFAYLYYPTTPQGLPPYDVEPGLMWHLLLERSERGVRRSLAAYGGRELRLLGYDCGAEVSREGDNTISGPCVMRVRDEQGKTVSLRLFSQILERSGRYKFLSYANKL